MAERRSIHRKVSVSTDLAALGDKHGGWAFAFALALIPHYDRYGCVADDPAKLKGLVLPLVHSVTAEDVKKWVAWMVRRGMLERVKGPGGDRGLRSTAFHEHQVGAQLDREGRSPFEPESFTTSIGERRGRLTRKDAYLQGGLRPVTDHSQTGLSEVKGKERKGREYAREARGPSFGDGKALTPAEIAAMGDRERS